MSTQKVLVTGASGFIAKYVIAELLRQGYQVQATLRNLDRAGEARRGIAGAGASADGVTFFQADLLSDEGWDAAVEGCTYVMHVASPFPLKHTKDADTLIRPAREGAVRVLKAATRAGVKRVVLTSSVVAITLPWPEASLGHVFDETDWTNPERPDISAYVVSKTLAERAAWEYVKETPGAPELAVVNPAFVLGPAADADLSTSLEVIRLIGTGAYPAAPKLGFPISDVRDVAVSHVLAMTTPAAAGERFLTANGFMRLIEVSRLVKEALPDLARKVPKGELPDFLVRVVALVDTRLKAVLPDLGFPRPITNAKAHRILGQTFRSPKEAVISAATSLRALKVI
ncbi:MAG: NAD-dependent epimerase/dehydratase family protein [Hyphomicrobium sp.]|jgi:nucleoside-diphosphate-sugar epimerase